VSTELTAYVYWIDGAEAAIIRSVEDVLAEIREQAAQNAAGGDALMRLVVKASSEKKTLRDIAAAAGMSAEGVRKMLARAKRQTAEAPLDGKPNL
jgi:DNA-directed RNA polymerase sigma subunit (sigma70/sigma32)